MWIFRSNLENIIFLVEQGRSLHKCCKFDQNIWINFEIHRLVLSRPFFLDYLTGRRSKEISSTLPGAWNNSYLQNMKYWLLKWPFLDSEAFSSGFPSVQPPLEPRSLVAPRMSPMTQNVSSVVLHQILCSYGCSPIFQKPGRNIHFYLNVENISSS